MDAMSNETKRDLLAAAVASGSSLRRGAKAADLSPTTARRWAESPEFQDRNKALREQIILRTIGVLTRASVKASLAALDLLKPGVEDETRLKTIGAIFSDLVMLREHFAPDRGEAPGAPGLVVPGLDVRWEKPASAEGGEACATPSA